MNYHQSKHQHNRLYKAAVVTYEDRPQYETGMKLLVLSLEEYSPDVAVHVFAPNATPEFQAWMQYHAATLHHDDYPLTSRGWNVKPDVLTWALNQGHSRAIWLDSDIILSRSLPPELVSAPDEVMVASELPGVQQSTTHERTRSWGFEPGRSFAKQPSGCAMSVTRKHLALLVQWKSMLESPDYLYWQTRPRAERPRHFIGSDASLIALLGAQHYAHIPLHVLKCGTDIAQCLTPGSYGGRQRLNSLRHGVPPLIHAMGKKPWLDAERQGGYHPVSPYSCVARRYAHELSGVQEHTEQAWLQVDSKVLEFWHTVVQDHPALSSLPLAIAWNLRHNHLRSWLRPAKDVVFNKLLPTFGVTPTRSGVQSN
mgnify:CR=1 FL=1